MPGASYERLVAGHGGAAVWPGRQPSTTIFSTTWEDLGEELVGSDYRSEIFLTSDEQRQLAEDTIADASGFWGKVATKISEAGAEDQDYFQGYTDGSNQFSRYRSAAR